MNIALILATIRPGAQWSLVGNSYENLEWHGPGDKPTETEIVSSWPQVEQQTLKAQQDEQRRIAYVAEADPLFFKWQRNEGTEQAWLDKIAEIKARLPNPS